MQTIDSASQIIGGRYRLLNQLGSGGMGSVFRAVDRLSGQTVALKRVTQAEVGIQDGDSFGLRLALAREFHTLASLRHPHIISVLDYGFDEQGQPYLTMELLESAQDVLEAGKGLSLSAQLRLLVQLLQALLYLHRSGVIHRDLKPANVLVADAQVKVLDFGLAATRGETDVNSDHVSGTLAYMAPELLSGATANEASDLYAVGIIAYQLLAGHHPFDRANMAVLLQQIVEAQPNVEQLGVDSRLAGVIERLLAKSPDKRYSEAALVVAALGQATDQELSLETAITRESFLQASRFVGRDAELKQLVATLTPAIAGQGSAWLVGGESGVGKSRLLDEVRTQALVRGVLVLRGQVISEGSSPYQLWRDILRRLILTIDLSDFEAGVLMSLVPDISALLERPIPEVPDVEGQAVQERLLSTIEAIFRRQQQPILLLIEDLHWATESLDVLQRLTRIAHDLPLVIIGSYRSDERPDLPEVLQNMRLLGLNRFAGNHLAELSESMLGAAGRRPEIINLLQKETEGNVFFLVEVVRSLAEEAGELDKIGTMELPEKVVAGGVESILQRRLKRVPQSAYKLLELAAVSGRLLDLKILGSLDPTTNLDQWLSSCASVPVLDVQDGRWRFSHDKLRETMLATLPDERRPTLHEQVAKVIEQNYPDAPDRYAELAYHWKAAGVTVKAADYLGKAGEQALRVYANQDAASFFSEAIALLPLSDSPDGRAQAASREQGLGQAFLNLGRVPKSLEHFERALALYGRLAPRSGAGLVLSLLRQVAVQVSKRLRPFQIVESPARPENDLQAAARIYFSLSQLYYFQNNALLATDATLRALNLGEEARNYADLGRYFINGCLAMELVSLRSLADTYYRQAFAVAERSTDLSAVAYVKLIGSIYDLDMGRWDSAQTALDQAIELNLQLGDERWRREVLTAYGYLCYHRGQFAAGQARYVEGYNSALRSDDAQHKGWALMGQGHGALRLGDLDKAILILESALELDMKSEPRLEANILAMLGVARLRGGHLDAAHQTADKASAVIAKIPAQLTYQLEGYACIAEVYLALWEANGYRSSSGDAELPQKAHNAYKKLLKYAHTYPSSLGRAQLAEGAYFWLSGQATRANQSWRNALAEADRLAMPYVQGLAYCEIGRHTDKADPSRKGNLSRAAELFDKTGAAWDLKRATELLSI